MQANLIDIQKDRLMETQKDHLIGYLKKSHKPKEARRASM